METKTLESSSVKKAELLQNWLVAKVAEQCNLEAEAIDTAKPLTYYGLDSIIAFTIVGDLEDWLEIELPATLMWDHPTIEEVVQYLTTEAVVDLQDE